MHPVEETQQAIVRAQQLRAISALTPYTMVASSFNALVACVVFYGTLSLPFLVSWAGTILIFGLYLFWHWVRAQKRRVRLYASKKAIRLAATYNFLIGSVWAVFVIVAFPASSDNQMIFVVVIYVGMMCAGVLASASAPSASIAYAVPIATGGGIAIITSGIVYWPYMVLLFLSFCVVVFTCARNFYGYLEEAVTRRIETLEQKKVIELLLNDFGDFTSDVLLQTDENLDITYYSKPDFFQLGSVNPDPQSKQSIIQILERFGGAGQTRSLEKNMRAQRPFSSQEFSLKSPKNVKIWVSISGNPNFQSGIFVGYRCVVSDVTKMKRATLESERARMQAEQVSREKANFAALVSHEFRTPLNAIIGYSEVIESQLFGPIENKKYEEYVGFIASSGRRLKRLIDDVSLLSRLDAGKVTMSQEPLEVARIAQDMENQYRSQAERLGVNWQVMVEEDVLYIISDLYALEQILTNLIDNAFKFAPRGSLVKLSFARAAKGEICISVSDEGEGMEPAMIPALMEPFQQAKDASSSGAGGLGLGLAIVSKLARSLKMKLTIISEPGEGAAFQLFCREASNED